MAVVAVVAVVATAAPAAGGAVRRPGSAAVGAAVVPVVPSGSPDLMPKAVTTTVSAVTPVCLRVVAHASGAGEEAL
jgi:hypothetical protein